MADPTEFSQKVINAVETKTEWYNQTVMPQFLDNYRLLHTCVKNLYDLLIKKSLIKPDPYKLDRKISGITPLDNSQFIENDRITVIGIRFSEYETILDWICTYYKFSIEHLTIPEIKKLLDYNNSFLWANLSPNSPMPNTRGLGQLIMEIKHNADALTSSSVIDIINKCQNVTKELAAMFRDLSEFQKEVYKCRIRKEIFQHPKFDRGRAFNSANEEMTQIKKAFPHVFSNEPFYGQLVEEVIREDQSGNKELLQEAVLKKLLIEEDTHKKKAKTIDTREMLLGAIQTLCAFSTQFQSAYNKISENNEIMQSESNSLWKRLIAILRKAFGISESPVEYDLTIIEASTNTQRKQKLDFVPFCTNLQKKINFYNSFSVKASAGYKKFLEASESKLLDFLNKQITDIQKIRVLLKALDDFFKNNALPEHRQKIKGISMELMAIKNNLVNTNQRRAEYISYIEEQEQMKKLGITN